MRTSAIVIPIGKPELHLSCITFPEVHQPPLVMSATCVSLSFLGACWYYSMLPCPAKVLWQWTPKAIRVGMESEALQTIYFFSGPVFSCCQGYIGPHGHLILMVICQALPFTSKVPPNSGRKLAIQWHHVYYLNNRNQKGISILKVLGFSKFLFIGNRIYKDFFKCVLTVNTIYTLLFCFINNESKFTTHSVDTVTQNELIGASETLRGWLPPTPPVTWVCHFNKLLKTFHKMLKDS